jgi:ATP-dependent Clp protease ATP-binding subunit ClpC
MTSNIGADLIRKGSGLGFGEKTANADYERLKSQMLDEAKRVFKPELLNRLDDLIVFRQLTREDVMKILDLEVRKVRDRLSAKHIELHLAESAREFLINKGFDPMYGARQLRRAVERHLEDPLAEEILRGNVTATEVVEVTADVDKLKFGQLAGAS